MASVDTITHSCQFELLVSFVRIIGRSWQLPASGDCESALARRQWTPGQRWPAISGLPAARTAPPLRRALDTVWPFHAQFQSMTAYGSPIWSKGTNPFFIRQSHFWARPTSCSIDLGFGRPDKLVCFCWIDFFAAVYHFVMWQIYIGFNPLAAKWFNLNFHSLEVVTHWRDPQLHVSENYSDLTKWRSIADWCHILSLTYLKCGT